KLSRHGFAPGLVGTYQDSEGGGGRHRSSPLSNGSSSWRGSPSRRLPRQGLERDFFFFARLSATSCLIGQPLALCALDRAIGALGILDADGGSMVVAKVEL